MCAEQNRALKHAGDGCVFVFFMDLRKGVFEKDIRCSVEGGTFDEEGLHIPRYYHYPLFIMKQGDYYYE